MRIALTGGRGRLAPALAAHLEAVGHEAVLFSRSPSGRLRGVRRGDQNTRVGGGSAGSPRGFRGHGSGGDPIARRRDVRLRSVTDQSYPAYELIVLDDASTDDSVEVAPRFLDGVAIDHQVVESRVNGGSVSRQWLAGVERARGELVWIAEADDLSDPRFLETLVQDFARPEVVMSHCESRRIDADERVVDASYLDYVLNVGVDRWRQLHVIPGSEALATFMSVKNTIPNVSACLFRRTVLHETLRDNIEEISGDRVAGDWATYAHVLTRGSLAFFPAAYNMHRRHAQGVTAGARPGVMMHETLSMQHRIRL